jgi:sugar lactone lactonase YvrE
VEKYGSLVIAASIVVASLVISNGIITSSRTELVVTDRGNAFMEVSRDGKTMRLCVEDGTNADNTYLNCRTASVPTDEAQ